MDLNDVEIEKELTMGWLPLGYCLIWKGFICYWDGEMLMTRLVDDNQRAEAYRAFLLKRGAKCDSIQELNEFARRNEWVNWKPRD